MRRSSSGLVTPPRMRGNHREGAVLLDVGVHAVVDEPRRAVLVVIAAPQHVEHVAEGRLAHLAADAVAVDLQHLLHRLQPLAAQDVAQLVLGKRQAGADDLLDLVLELGRHRAQQVLAQAGAAAAARAGARALLELGHRVDALLVDRLDDGALGDADAAADGGAVGHRRHFPARVGGGRREEQVLRWPEMSASVRSQSM
jgi:hypothetical protein